ncbi:MAG: hypothetical protein LWW95_11185 [Candidatus Desulfofervidus auxilii]|nr:hypothetical protein [Candidatus Desulfofervidus auxilii]
MSTKWMLISEVWSLNKTARWIGDALTALTLLKFKMRGLRVDENEKDLKERILKVRIIINNLLKEIKFILKSGYGPSPLLKAVQEEYGYANLKRVEKRLGKILEILKHIEKGNYSEEDFEEIERMLECIAYEASTLSEELITQTGRY